MISAHELRLGNWIKLDSKKVWHKDYNLKPVRVTIDELVHIENDGSFYSPIELTIDLLRDFGFRDDFSTFEYADGFNNGKVFITYFNCILSAEFGNGNKNIPVDLRYVHQLQNLYYSLTQTELNIEL